MAYPRNPGRRATITSVVFSAILLISMVAISVAIVVSHGNKWGWLVAVLIWRIPLAPVALFGVIFGATGARRGFGRTRSLAEASLIFAALVLAVLLSTFFSL